MGEELDFIPLARAAAMVHERLFPEHPTKETKTLDVIALALSTVIPLYRRDMQSGAVQAVSEKELAEGRFTRGATTLEVPYRAPVRFLVVARGDLQRATETLVRDSAAAARVSLTLRQSPRSPLRG